jgi:sec-independent protein translocase protein TatA
MQLGLPEILVVGVIIVMLFGVGRIGKVGGELGKGIREFRTALRQEDATDQPAKVAEGKSEAGA